jgi:hypothetical protein
MPWQRVELRDSCIDILTKYVTFATRVATNIEKEINSNIFTTSIDKYGTEVKLNSK